MGNEKRFQCFCPECGKEKQSRRRDIGKLCSSCNMKKVELEHRKPPNPNAVVIAREYQKKYRDKKRGCKLRRASILVQQAKVRATRSNLPFNLTVQDVLDLWPQDNKCPVFGYEFKLDSTKKDKNFSPSLDKVVPWLGYVKENVRLISWEANRKKSDSSASDLKAILAYIERES